MKTSMLLGVVITTVLMIYPDEVYGGLWRSPYYVRQDGAPSQIAKRYQQSYGANSYSPRRNNYIIPQYQPGTYSGPWAQASQSAYQPPVYNPWKAFSVRTARSQQSRSSCPSTMNPTLQQVLKEAIKHENDKRGNQKPEALKSISNSDVKNCRECMGNKCRSYQKVELAMTIAPACKTKSKHCICGVDRSYPKRLCTVSAKADLPLKGVYDLLIFCERRLPDTELKAWRRKQKAHAKRLRKSRKAKRARKRKRKRRKFKSNKLKKLKSRRRPAKSRKQSRKGNEIPEDTDSSAEGPVHPKPAPIVFWDETASQATIVIPKRSVDKLDIPKKLL